MLISRPSRTVSIALVLGAFSLVLACPGLDDELTCDPLTAEQIAEEVASSEGPLNDRDPILIEELAVVFTCDEIPDNQQGLGDECDTHADCGHEQAICVKGILPCQRGRCTARCRTDRECHTEDLTTDLPAPFVCVIAQDQLSICLPSSCLPRIPGWDETCGPLSGVAVNDLGVGQACESQADCDLYPGSVCPPPGSPERVCSRPCETDPDCGARAACVCVDDVSSETCLPWSFVCAPAEGCADAVRHHHCRGDGVPPRDHETACGGH